VPPHQGLPGTSRAGETRWTPTGASVPKRGAVRGYAIDGYTSILATMALWWIVGRMTGAGSEKEIVKLCRRKTGDMFDQHRIIEYAIARRFSILQVSNVTPTQETRTSYLRSAS